MNHKIHICGKALSCLIMAALLLAVSGSFAFADEEYIPEEYYESIQSNSTSGWPEGQAIQASAGVVMDLDTGAFLYSKNCDRQLYPASITKIMTCLLVLEHADLDAVMTCSSVVYELDENASNTGLQEGEQMTIRDALYTLMLESANDTANALAEYVSGSIDAFAQLMNDRAASLGCTGTHFSNPSGLSADDHYTTAHDMALIAQAAYANEGFRTLCGTAEYQVAPTNLYEEDRYLSNHHQMVKGDTDYYMPWCTGGKTGFTQAAWNTLVTYGEKDGKRLVCVLLHGNGADQNYLETIDLMNYGFNNFRHLDLSGSTRGGTLADVMGVHYLGRAAGLEAPELQQTISQKSGVMTATVPEGVDLSMLSVAAQGDAPAPGEAKTVPFTYNGWPVGSLQLAVPAVNLRMSYPWQRAVQVSVQGQTGDKEVELRDTNEIVWQNIGQFTNDIAGNVTVFIDENRTTVILVTGLILIVLLLLLLLLLLQSTRDYRSHKKMRAAREEAQRLEAEIDAKSAIEIEEELRRAMREEMEKKEEDTWKEDPNLQDLDLRDRGEDR